MHNTFLNGDLMKDLRKHRDGSLRVRVDATAVKAERNTSHVADMLSALTALNACCRLTVRTDDPTPRERTEDFDRFVSDHRVQDDVEFDWLIVLGGNTPTLFDGTVAWKHTLRDAMRRSRKVWKIWGVSAGALWVLGGAVGALAKNVDHHYKKSDSALVSDWFDGAAEPVTQGLFDNGFVVIPHCVAPMIVSSDDRDTVSTPLFEFATGKTYRKLTLKYLNNHLNLKTAAFLCISDAGCLRANALEKKASGPIVFVGSSHIDAQLQRWTQS